MIDSKVLLLIFLWTLLCEAELHFHTLQSLEHEMKKTTETKRKGERKRNQDENEEGGK